MIKLTEKEMMNISAGALSGTLISAAIRGLTSFSDLGRYFGSSIRRIVSKSMCGF